MRLRDFKKGDTMEPYHKITTVYKRDPKTKYKTLLEGKFALPEFKYLANNQWQFSEKVDGPNIRIMFDGEQLAVGGRTDKAQPSLSLVWRLHDIFLPKLEAFKELGVNDLCLYGEWYEAKIQKGGGNYRQDQGFVLFDVKVGVRWLRRSDVESIAEILDIEVVPAIGSGTLAEMVEMARQGFQSAWGDFTAEGIVARPAVELKTRSGYRVITKVKCKDFQ